MEREGEQEVEDSEAPELIEAVSRLLGDVTAMLFLAEGDLPRKVQVRPSCSDRVYVGFGDAAKAGYDMAVADVSEANQVAVSSMELTTASGDTMTLTDDSPPVHAEYGHWTETFGNNSFFFGEGDLYRSHSKGHRDFHVHRQLRYRTGILPRIGFDTVSIQLGSAPS